MQSIKKSINSISNCSPFKSIKSSRTSRVLNCYMPIPNNNNSRIREIIYDLNENRQEYNTYQFLLLLSDDYYKKKMGILPSKKYYIKKSKFPGNIIIEKYSDFMFNNSQYSFESNPIPNQLYIKLQKERIYVLYNEYEYKLLESKFNEFFDILTVIGAKYIKISKKIDNVRQTDVSVNASITANIDELGLICKDGTISNKTEYHDENESSLIVKQEMSFNNTKEPELNKLLDNYYYYLPKQMDLQQLIIRRIENNLISDRFIYNHYQHNLLNTSLISSLQKLSIGINYRTKNISSFQIEYEILFNSIKDPKLNLIHDDETPWLYRTISNFINRFY
jgi:hypothetical protein